MFRPSHLRRFPYPHHKQIPFPPLPAVSPSELPQTVAPTSFQKGIQMTGFVLAIGLTFYSVLVYDFGTNEHCFMPIRRKFDTLSSGFFTLSDQERLLVTSSTGEGSGDGAEMLGGEERRNGAKKPSTNTPIEFFKQRKE